MPLTLLWIALLIALFDWIAVAINIKPIRYIAKPGVMLVLLIWLGTLGGFRGPMMWFALGALFSLGGDVFLILPQEQFIASLISFFLAHVTYIIGFNQTFPPVNIASLVVFLIISLTAAGIYRRISLALLSESERKLRVPILAYTVTISSMLVSALITLIRPDDQWSPFAALLVSVGALLFFLSDVLLAWNRFVKPLAQGRLKVIIAYHFGQIGILLGAALQFIK